jgi:uncharacterized membrane protein
MKKLLAFIKPLFKPLIVGALVVALVFSQADSALAARGGRVGGGCFRAPSSYPSRTYRPPAGGGGYGYGYPGGGFGFPFIFPIFGIGGGFGGLFGILIMFAIASFLIRSFRSITAGDDEYGYSTSSPTVSVAKLQVGLLAEARSLQEDMNRIARSANTGSTEGLAQVLQETTLSLLRHPEYWVYGAAQSQQARLEAAEGEFNRLALAERSKFTEESLSNVNNQLRQASVKAELPGAGGALSQQPGEYIVATVIVGTEGKLNLPKITSSDDLRRAISQIGSVSSDRLLALEVLWTPQEENDTLSSEEVIALYPDLALV